MTSFLAQLLFQQFFCLVVCLVFWWVIILPLILPKFSQDAQTEVFFLINSFPRELSPRTFSPLSIYTGVLSTSLVHLIPKQLWYPYCWYHFPRFTDMETEQARLSNLLEIAHNNGGMGPQRDIWMRAFNCYVTLLCVQWHQSWKRLGRA